MLQIAYHASAPGADLTSLHVALRVTRDGKTVSAFALASVDELEALVDGLLTSLHDILEGKRTGTVDAPDLSGATALRAEYMPTAETWP